MPSPARRDGLEAGAEVVGEVVRRQCVVAEEAAEAEVVEAAEEITEAAADAEQA